MYASTESTPPRSRHAKKASVGGRVPSRSTGHKDEPRATSRKEETRTAGHKGGARVTLSRGLTLLEEVLAANMETAFPVAPAGKDMGVASGQGLSVFMTQDEGE